MGRGHGIIINMTSWMPFIFTFNPVEVETNKKINWSLGPNAGGSHRERFFAGFESKEVSFDLMCVDTASMIGVSDEVAFFDALREPDAGLFGIAGSFFGNENYPPPKVLFGFGTSLVPLVWDVLDVGIITDHFKDGDVSGVIGIPKKAEISITLALDEEHPLYKVNQIAKKALTLSGSVDSIVKEVIHKSKNKRKEMISIYGRN